MSSGSLSADGQSQPMGLDPVAGGEVAAGAAAAAGAGPAGADRPELAVGAAFAGGLVVALILKRLAH